MAILTGARLERARASKQFHDGKFRNTHEAGMGVPGPTFKVLKEFALNGRQRRPVAPLPVDSPIAAWREPAPASGLRVTWLGHSTLLLEIDGFRILTDPVFGKRASPFPFGPKRFHPVPATIAELPPIDLILQSHDHYDHLCRPSIEAIAKLRIPFITSLGVGARLEGFGVDPRLITELDWWEERTIGGGAISITAAPAQHFSGRSLTDRNTTLWSSWVIASAKKRIFFSGDTGLTDELEAIGQRLGPFDLSLIEIGASNPAWSAIHLGPENALKAFEMLGGGTLLPIHWATFDLALHRWDEPAETLLNLAEPLGVRVITPRLGEVIDPAASTGPNRWWRSVVPKGSVYVPPDR